NNTTLVCSVCHIDLSRHGATRVERTLNNPEHRFFQTSNQCTRTNQDGGITRAHKVAPCDGYLYTAGLPHVHPERWGKQRRQAACSRAMDWSDVAVRLWLCEYSQGAV